MKAGLTAVAAFPLLLAPGALTAQEWPSPNGWDRVKSSKEAGWSGSALDDVRELADSIGTDALMIVRGGRVVLSWGKVARPYRTHSIRKSLLHSLYGVHLERDNITLDRTVGSVGIEAHPPLRPRESDATLLHLLASRSGIYRKAAHENAGWDDVRPARGSHPPGTRFFYSNWDFNIAGIALSRVTETNLFAAFKREIARPLGMQDFRLVDGGWRYDRSRSPHPAYVFRMSARDLARYGLLYLRCGRWRDRQIVPRRWIERSTRPRSQLTHPRTGEKLPTHYGLLWYSSDSTVGPYGVRSAGRDPFWASGTGTQLLAVLPEHDLVIVHREDTDDDREQVGEQEHSVSGEELGRLLELILQAHRGSSDHIWPRQKCRRAGGLRSSP